MKPMSAKSQELMGEYTAACERAAVFDLADHGQVEVSGPDAASFLHNLSTNDVKGLAPQTGCEAFLPTGQAKIVAYVLIERLSAAQRGEIFFIDAGPGMGEKVVKHLDRHLISEQVELLDRSQEIAELHLAGPQSRQILSDVLLSVPVDLRPLMSTQLIGVANLMCRVRRYDRLGLPGYDLLVAREQSAALRQNLLSAGAGQAGPETYRTLRIEAGTPVYGLDIDETNLPQEVARIDRTVSFTKGCYIGQETVARIRTYGHVNRSLVGLTQIESGSLERGQKLFREGQEVGQITSAAQSPRVAAAIALAYVRRGSQEPGTKLEVQAAGGPATVEVVALPFVASGAGATG
jgi:folate-binding protein YgfZ